MQEGYIFSRPRSGYYIGDIAVSYTHLDVYKRQGYTYLVRTGILSMDELINLMSFRPFDILGIERNLIKKGCKANFILINPNEEYIFMADRGYSKSVNTPYDKMTLFGRVKYNIVNGGVNKCQQAVL